MSKKTKDKATMYFVVGQRSGKQILNNLLIKKYYKGGVQNERKTK